MGDRKFTYDARGNLIKEHRGKEGKIETRYHYNLNNQLIKVEKGKQTTEYRYDPLGRRTQKRDEFGNTHYLWAGDQLVQEERLKIRKTYIFEPESFKPVAMVQDENIYHYHLDYLGTPQELSANDGNIVWKAKYKTYGNVAVKEVEDVENNPRFQGQYFDEETGLHYNRHRYYDPNAGQFTSQDPIGLLGGVNNYQYAANPISWIDPLGLTCKEFKTQHEAAEYVSRSINPSSISENLEYGGMIFQRGNGTYGYTGPIKGTLDGVNPGGPTSVPDGTAAVAYWHTHGGDEPGYDSENFSNAYDPVDKIYYGDIPYADHYEIDGYVATPSGAFKHYFHETGDVSKLDQF